MRKAPMRMVGIDLTEKQDSSFPTTCWEFQHCKRVRGVALDKVRHYENGVFIGSIVTKAPNGCWVPTRLAVYSFKVREIVPADRWDVWCIARAGADGCLLPCSRRLSGYHGVTGQRSPLQARPLT